MKTAKGHATLSPFMFSSNNSCYPGTRTLFRPVPDHTDHYLRLNAAICSVVNDNKLGSPISNKKVGFTNHMHIKPSDYEGILDPHPFRLL